MTHSVVRGVKVSCKPSPCEPVRRRASCNAIDQRRCALSIKSKSQGGIHCVDSCLVAFSKCAQCRCEGGVACQVAPLCAFDTITLYPTTSQKTVCGYIAIMAASSDNFTIKAVKVCGTAVNLRDTHEIPLRKLMSWLSALGANACLCPPEMPHTCQ